MSFHALPTVLHTIRYAMVLSIILTLAACTYRPSKSLPTTNYAALSHLSADTHTTDMAGNNTSSDANNDSPWWHHFGESDLVALMQSMSADNIALEVAQLRIDKARALVSQQKSSRLPQLQGNLSGSSRHSGGEQSTSSALSFRASYEVDLWRKLSAEQMIADLNVSSQELQQHSLHLQQQATLAQLYFENLALVERIALAEGNLQASQDVLTLITVRFEAGSASGIELKQQRNTLYATKTQLLSLRQAFNDNRSAMAILLGQDTRSGSEWNTTFNKIQIPHIAKVQPASLLESRPDVLLAANQFRADEALLFQTQKRRWPTLSISGSMGLDDLDRNNQDWSTSLIASLAAPILNANGIQQQITAAETELSIAEQNYQQVVLEAIHQTRDTLDHVEYWQQLVTLQLDVLENNRTLYELARLRYDSGDADFLHLLNAQRSWFSAQDQAVQSKVSLLNSVFNLYKALGAPPHLE